MSEDFFKVIETEGPPGLGPDRRDSIKSIEELNQEIESLNNENDSRNWSGGTVSTHFDSHLI